MTNDTDEIFACNLIFKTPLKSNDNLEKEVIILPVDKEVGKIDFMFRLSEAIAKVSLSREKFLHYNAMALDSDKHQFQWPTGKPFILPKDGLDAYLGRGDGTGARYISDLKNYSVKKKEIKQNPQGRIYGRLRMHSMYFAVYDYPTYYWIIKGSNDNEQATPQDDKNDKDENNCVG